MASAKLPITSRAHTGERIVDDAQRLAQRAASKVNGQLFNDGVLVQNQAITTAGTIITHGLGRKPNGWIVTRLQGNASALVEATAANQPPDLTRQIKLLAASATVTADVYFF